MANKIVLVSDDADFFDFIKAKLELRKSDELFCFSFDDIPEKSSFLEASVLIVNSENIEDKTLDLLRLFNGLPFIIMSYNDDDIFRRKCYRAGAIDFMTLLTPDAEFRARIIPALNVAGVLGKTTQYRKILVKKHLLDNENEIFIDYDYILDNELISINTNRQQAVFAAISPSEKSKFLLKQQCIEAIILNNLRRNDIVMRYAPNKYFVLFPNTDIKSVEKLWNKMKAAFQQKMYIGLCTITNQTKQQLINDVLNKLHSSINNDKQEATISAQNPINCINSKIQYSNFKMFKKEFGKQMEQVITPVFYQIQQKYSGKLMGVNLEQHTEEGFGSFSILGKYFSSNFKITAPGLSKINIDITLQKYSDIIDAKHITLEPEEFEVGLLEDLLEQFILEYQKGDYNENS